MIATMSVAGLLHRFQPAGDGEAAKSRELILAMLASSAAPFSRRQFNPGHITCSGLVLSPARDAVLLVFHRRLERWLLPGGHVEPEDASIADAGRREVVEETGAALRADDAPLLVSVDVHGIPPRGDEPFHLHHDLTFRYHAESLALQPCEEVRDSLWCAEAEFERYRLPGNVLRAYGRAIAAA